MKRILIPEDIPSHNKGEAALFYGMLESMKCLGNIEVDLFSLNPDADGASYGKYANIVDSRSITPGHIIDGAGSTKRKAFNYCGAYWR